MSPDVFIGFSWQDMGAADRICEALEATGLRCWMVHRDIAPGRDHLGPVLEAVDHCRALVLIVSSNTTGTYAYVLERAARRGVPIIWLTIGRGSPPAEFDPLRDSALVIDASMCSLQSHLGPIAVRINSLLDPTYTEDSQAAGWPGIQPTPPRQLGTKRDFILATAGLSVLAFGAGALFNKQIIGLLDMIAEYLRQLGVSAG